MPLDILASGGASRCHAFLGLFYISQSLMRGRIQSVLSGPSIPGISLHITICIDFCAVLEIILIISEKKKNPSQSKCS